MCLCLCVCVCVCVCVTDMGKACPGSDCQRECSWCLIWTKTRLSTGWTGVCVWVWVWVWVCACVRVCFIPPHMHALDVDSPLFVQCIHCGSYYCGLNGSLSTSSDLPLFLFLSPLSWSLFSSSFIPLPLFSSFSSFIFVQLCSIHAPLISSFPSWVIIALCLLAFSL